MSTALRSQGLSRDGFLDWMQAQDVRHEFDGVRPVATVGGTANHSQICQNIYAALRERLAGGRCRVLGPDAGVATIGDAVRYPDALVTCATFAGTERLIPGVVIVFEVLSPTSGRTDRIDKLREYRAVSSIRRYVILEHSSPALTVFARADGRADWIATPLTTADMLPLPEIAGEVPVRDFYAHTDVTEPLRS